MASRIANKRGGGAFFNNRYLALKYMKKNIGVVNLKL